MLPEARLIEAEVTLRDLQLTSEVKMTRKSLVRWVALASGLISPNESRRTVVDLLEVLFRFQLKEKTDPSVEDIVDAMRAVDEKHNEKAVRYHLGQLKKAGILANEKGKYFFSVAPFAEKGDVAATFEHVLKSKSDRALKKIQESLKLLKEMHERG